MLAYIRTRFENLDTLSNLNWHFYSAVLLQLPSHAIYFRELP
jgi:hypothetical protein